MSGRSSAAVGIWRARHRRANGDRAYLAYAMVLGVAVVVAPIARAVWLSAASAEGIAVLSSPAAPAIAAVLVALLWAGALTLGRERGPVVLAPFLTHALATSELRRSTAFRLPMLRSGALVVAATTAAAALVGAVLMSGGVADLLGVVTFTVAGVLVGSIAAVAWLAGQAFPRVATPLALGVLGLGMLTAVAPLVQPFTPWGWAGLLYPSGGPAPMLAASPELAALAALAVGLAVAAPAMLNRLSAAELTAQAMGWESVTGHAANLDLSMAATVYRGRPYAGRRIRAIRSGHPVPWVFLIRDAIGAIRTPGRLVAGLLALVAAGVLLTLAGAPTAPGWLLGAAAGLVAYAGLGALTDGIRHAASVASDFPLYGISDGRLLASHAVFPLIVVIVVLLVTVALCSLAFGLPAAAPVFGALALGPLALAARIGSSLKGPMPPVLLTPIPTPMGDMGAAARVIWAIDGLLLAGLLGASAALASELPALVAIVTAVLAGIGLSRWRQRA